MYSTAESIGMVTVADKNSYFVRQTVKFSLSPGTRLNALDLIETGHKSELVRIEFSNGIVADFGPETRVMLSPKIGTGSKRRQAPLYALNGWVKLSSKKENNSVRAINLLSEAMDIAELDGSSVILVQKSSNQVFSESGNVVIASHCKGKPCPPLALKQGAFLSKTGADKGVIHAMAPTSFVKEMPKAFLDAIPELTSRYKTKPIPALNPIGDLDYESARPWLNAEQDVKNLLVASWGPQLNSGLRTSIANNIRSHREWDRLLFPEKYLIPVKQSSTPVKQ